MKRVWFVRDFVKEENLIKVPLGSIEAFLVGKMASLITAFPG